jgi:hypothetical protein
MQRLLYLFRKDFIAKEKTWKPVKSSTVDSSSLAGNPQVVGTSSKQTNLANWGSALPKVSSLINILQEKILRSNQFEKQLSGFFFVNFLQTIAWREM